MNRRAQKRNGVSARKQDRANQRLRRSMIARGIELGNVSQEDLREEITRVDAQIHELKALLKRAEAHRDQCVRVLAKSKVEGNNVVVDLEQPGRQILRTDSGLLIAKDKPVAMKADTSKIKIAH